MENFTQSDTNDFDIYDDDSFEIVTGDIQEVDPAPKQTAVMAVASEWLRGGERDPLNLSSIALEPGGGKNLRQEAYDRWLSRFNVEKEAILVDAMNDPSTTVEDFNAIRDYKLTAEEENATKYLALEKETVEAANLSSQLNFQGLLRYAEMDDNAKSARDFHTEFTLKTSYLASVIAKRKEDQGFGGAAIDFVKEVVPFINNYRWSKVKEADSKQLLGDTIEEFRDIIRFGSMQEKATAGANFLEVVEELSRDNPMAAEGMLSAFNDDLNVGVENFFTGLDVIGTAADVATLGATAFARASIKATELGIKAPKLSDAALAHGSREAAVDMIESSVDIAKMSGDEVLKDEAIEALLPSAITPSLSVKEIIGAAGEASQRYSDRYNTFERTIDDVFTPNRLTEQEIQEGFERQKEVMAKQFHHLYVNGADDAISGNLFDIQTTKAGGHEVNLYVGAGEKRLDPFISKEAAQGFADNYLLKGSEYNIVERNEGFFLEFTGSMDESRLIKGVNVKDIFSKNGMARFWAGAKNLGTKWSAGSSQLAHNTRSRLEREFQKSIDAAQKLLGSDLDKFDEWAVHLQDENTWKSFDAMDEYYKERFGRTSTAKEKDAYAEYMIANDMHYKILNEKLHKSLTAKGYQRMELKGLFTEGVGKAVDKIEDDLAGATLLDLTVPGGKEFRLGEVTEGVASNLPEGKVLVRMAKPLHINDGQWQYVIVDRGQLALSRLPENVLGYAPGGRRSYLGDTYIKQSKIFYDKAGNRLKGKDKTHFVVESPTKAARYVEEGNKLLDALKTQNFKVATEILQSTFPDWGTVEEVMKRVDSGQLDLESPFEVVRSGGVTQRGLNDSITLKSEGFDDETTSLIEDTGFWFENHRGDRLKNPEGSRAGVVDPIAGMANMVNNATRVKAFDDLKIRSVNEWMTSFGKTLDLQEGQVFDRFMNGNLRREAFTNPDDLAAAENYRSAIKNFLQTATADEKLATNIKDQLFYKLDKRWPELGAKARNLTSLEPIQFLKAVTFNTFIGLGDISQFYMQTSLLPVIAATHGKQGMDGLAMASLYWLSRKSGHRAQQHLANKIAPKLGLDSKQVMDFFEETKRSGVEFVEMSQADLASLGHAHSYTKATTANISYYGGKVFKASRIFFDEAERYNKLTGYAIAFLNNGGKRFANADEAGQVARHAEALSGNMTTSSRAAWQRGGMGLLTQFKAYPFRIAELILTDGAGFTKGKRAKFAATLALAYGSSSMIGGFSQDLTTQYEKTFGGPMPEGLKAFWQDGLFGGLAHLAMGDERPSFDRVSAFKQNVASEILFEDKSIPELLPFVGAVTQLMGPAITSASYIRGMMNGTLQLEYDKKEGVALFEEVTSVLSGPKRMWKAMEILQTGKWVQKNGSLAGKTIAEFDDRIQAAISTVFFGKPYSVEETFTEMKKLSNDKKYISSIVKEKIYINYEKAFRQENTEQETRYYLRKAQNMLDIYSTNIISGEKDPILDQALRAELKRVINKNAVPLSKSINTARWKTTGFIAASEED